MKIEKELPKYKLQPLRIPSGWEISYNSLTELDPALLNKDEHDKWLNFTEDLLQIKNSKKNILLDVGWYPEADPEGVYGLDVVEDFNWENPVTSFETNQKGELIEKVEFLLWQLS
ncbi:hypothetical protein MHH54_09175 [Bacillus sp. FSL K6-4563]|uniref:Uncharacterized protein n=1 Tax=Bacillus pumilus TaxID=1408 RepID=A0AB34QRY3_BACPU|nr:hypothetical protein [Bacillus pumilus]EDW23516.1 conserved hypothetical protein [Bacillus pumilus ATCC 7061]KIL14046.1 hypothetical protein B4127_2005 [Bacillus pumilus]MBB6604109.1 hypothetical protein [Bacillus pumilus]MBU8573455.1 hypothetical protein [Bacillus pumilus]MBU8607935.1 hypothetical protein [Bacillus pumilus]